MEKIVVDTSVAVKWFVSEPKSIEAVDLLNNHNEKTIRIVVPDIIRLELINGLFYSYRFKSSQLNGILTSLKSSNIDFISIDKIDLNNVTNLMEEFSIASYDCLFIALAQKLDCPLVTNDRKHHLKKMYRKIRYL